MRYVSTRGEAPPLDFVEVMLAGLARDGGLYVPETWPRLDAQTIAGLAGRPYAEVALEVIRPFLSGSLDERDLARMTQEAYGSFRHPATVPLVQIAPNTFVLELFHGPTLAFKDLAMQLIARLMDHVLAQRGERRTIAVATSGDTGGAAVEAFRGRNNIDLVVLYPHGRVSDVQRQMMTTAPDSNVHALAIEGTFDDCQALVKSLFNHHAFRDRVRLSAVNSINWARIAAQVVYYFTAAAALGAPHRKVAFTVPTGNFGDVYAGYVAHRMGLPLAQLIVATHRNDILARFFDAGVYRAGAVVPTTSPSMDIQVASNFERLLFDLCGRDGAAVAQLMTDFRAQRSLTVSADALGSARELFDAARVDEAEVAATMADVLRATGTLIDPHTAVGVAAGRRCRQSSKIPLVALATADPAKFPDAVRAATGITPALPARLAELERRPERFTLLPNDLAAVRRQIEQLALETA
jgi:threonine synthase